jgi:RNA polymerase sigma-70 factor (ECF subfamily)
MSDDDSLKTSLTLLGRLGRDPKDQAAWSDFVARYGPRVLQWCRGWGLQESDAQDVTQDVLLKLNGLIVRFVYDPSGSFRGWLKTLTHHAWRDLVDKRRRSRFGDGDGSVFELLADLQAGDDLVERLDEEFRQEVLDGAMERVRWRVSERTWDAFRLTALEGLSGSATARRLEMKIARVYRAKSQVKEMIREEVRELEGLERRTAWAATSSSLSWTAPCGDGAGEELVRSWKAAPPASRRSSG